MQEKLSEVKARFQEIRDLQKANAVLNWEKSTTMPPRGAPARGRQMATLARLAQEKLSDPEIGRLLDDLASYGEGLPYDHDDAALIRVARRDYERATRVPPAFMAEFYAHASASYQQWVEARPANDFAAVRPYLEKTLDLSRRYADFFPGYDHIADPLIDESDLGMKATTIGRVFSELRQQLVPLVQAIGNQPPADDSCLKLHYPEAEQLPFGAQIIRRFGFDFSRGRQDKSPHPFMTSFSIDDARITTRVDERDLSQALFSTLHEAGHALYELGCDPAYEATPLAGGVSSGVHESQSRLWENLVGRSLAFWELYYPQLQRVFPAQLDPISLDTFYRAVNKVQRSLVRTDADEVTYNLHVMIRFDLELAMLEGNLAVKDLPDAWQARYQSDLGLQAPDHRDGVLQDVHWYDGSIGGAFQGYTLGNIMSALFFEQAQQDHPEIGSEIGQGRFDTLHGWLKEHIYRHGRKFTPDELVERVTGGPLTIRPYMRYLKGKFGELYGLDLE